MLLTIIGLVVILATLVTQVIGVIPVRWTRLLLDNLNAQVVLLITSWIRDSLGIYSIVGAFLGLLAAFGSWRLAKVRKPSQRFRKSLVVLSVPTVAMTIVVWCVIVGSVAAAGGGFHPFAPTLPVAAQFGKPNQIVTVGKADGINLTAGIYLPSNHGSNAVPVVVHIHGGGFIAGSAVPGPYNRYLADHGYAVLDVNYRLASTTNHTWRTQVGDVGCALTWVTTQRSFGLDTSKVAIVGESAGGGLALNAAYQANSSTLTPTCRTRNEIPHISAVVGGYPAADLTQGQKDSAAGKFVGDRYVGGSPAQFPAAYRSLDAKNHANSSSPPTLIYQGGSDHLILARTTRRMVHDLRVRGVTVKYEEFFGLDHGVGGILGVLGIGDMAGRELTVAWLHAHVN